MSALFTTNSWLNLSSWIPITVLFASLAGSGHCVAMCGGLVLASTRNRPSWVAYHLGRLSGYLSLGAVAGWIGSRIFSLPNSGAVFGILSWGAASLMAGLFILAGFRIWRGRSLHFSLVPARSLSWAFRKAGSRSLILGLLTAFLPCGWLHSFVLAAVATQAPIRGAGLLFAFWLGTLPALGLAPWMLTQVFTPLTRRSPRFSAILLVATGILSLGLKIVPTLQAPSSDQAPTHCHGTSHAKHGTF